MKAFLYLLVIIILLLGGCSTPAAGPTPFPTLTLTPTYPQTVKTLAPKPVATASPIQKAETGTPFPYPAVGENPTPASYPAPQEEAAALADEAVPFQDCSRTPGLVGCSDSGPALNAYLAVSDRGADRLIVLNLRSGQGWQSPGAPDGLAWLEGGGKLVSWQMNDGGVISSAWTANGEALETPSADQLLAWQPDGSLAPVNTLTYSGGWQYRLELLQGEGWVLFSRSPQGEESEFILDADPADQIYQFVARAPKSGKLLLQVYSPTNQSLLSGGDLLMVDPQVKQARPLAITAALLDEPGRFAVNPAQPGMAAFEGAGGEPGLTRLGLLDLESGEVRYPLPEGIASGSPDWSPDGSQLAFSADPLLDRLSGAERQKFPGPGIYLMTTDSEAVELLVNTPPSAQDGGPHWTADSSAMIFGRIVRDFQDAAGLEIHSVELSTRKEAVLFNGLPVTGMVREAVNWAAYFAVGR